MPPKPASPTPKSLPSDLPTHTFASPQAFTTFLTAHAATSPGIYLQLARKASGIPSITTSEAVECALCFGWINGRGNAHPTDPEHYWLSRYTPRRPKSIWSKRNVETVERLEREGRMTEAGRRQVEEAKGDGRWERAYAGGLAGMGVVEDVEGAIDGTVGAREVWEGLGGQEKYTMLLRVETAGAEVRAKRVEALVKGLVKRGAGGKGAEKEKKKVGARKKPVSVKSEGKKKVKRKDIASVEEEEEEEEEEAQIDASADVAPRRTGLRSSARR